MLNMVFFFFYDKIYRKVICVKEVNVFLNSLKIKEADVLVIAVSYGPDSMFLLDIIKNKYKNNKVVCCHVHHNHRKESDH